MSLEFLLETKDSAVVWRGPKKSGIIYTHKSRNEQTNNLSSLIFSPVFQNYCNYFLIDFHQSTCLFAFGD